MADFTITIYVEGFIAAAGTGDDPPQEWLGRCLTVALSQAPNREFTQQEKEMLAKLLCPWKWESIEWQTPGTPLRLPGKAPVEALESYLGQLIDGHPAADGSPLAFRHGGDEVDDAEETVPIWPGLLAQLARTGPQLSHALNLAHVARVAGAGPHPLALDAIVIEGTRFPADGSGDPFGILCEAEEQDLLPSGETGLVDHSTRLVLRGSPADRNATAAWLAELPSRAGRAIDPLARLADLAEAHVTDQPTHGEPQEAVKRMLLDLFGGYPDYDAERFKTALLLIADLAAASPTEKEDFAREWSNAFGPKREKLVDDLVAEFPLDDETLNAAELREAHSKPALRRQVQEALKTTVPAQPGACREAALAWLATNDNVDVFFRAILPEILARGRFLPRLIAGAGGKSADWDPLLQKFDDAFDAELEALSLRSHPDVTAEAKAKVFQIESDGIDAAAVDGLPFRTDTIFLDKEQDHDVHLMLDGYLAAISDRTPDRAGWREFKLVSQGSVGFAHHINGVSAPEAQLRLVGVHSPLPVVFDVRQEPSGGNTETRIAADSYRGEPLIPWSERRPPIRQDEGAAQLEEISPIEVLYAPDGAEHPPLAYGQDYRLVCGYQSPGGVLPCYFSTQDQPLVFDPAALHGCPDKFVSTIELRRTLPPGAPRLLALGTGSRPVVFAGPNDAETRPLWREQVALWPSELERERRILGEAATLYLDDAYPATSAHKEFSFTARPPALALGDSDENATTALVWRYWKERDRQWAGTDAAHLERPEETQADDPAVVGTVKGEPGRGGIYFRLHEIRPDGLERDVVDPQRAILKEDQRVDVTIAATRTDLGIEYTEPTLEGVARLVIQVPRDRRLLFEAWTICDGRFLEDGEDERFSKSAELKGTKTHDDILFGAARLAIEALPEDEHHLPTPEALWNLILAEEDAATGQVSAWLKRPEDAETAQAADFIGSVHPLWQRWRWDGGPVISYEDDRWGNLEANRQEPEGTSRSDGYEAFESVMFEGRGEGGATANIERSAGAIAKLVDLENLRNRGADYLRLRFDVRSRYAPLRPGARGNKRQAGVLSSLEPNILSLWRGYTIGVRRRDRLPTPRLSLAAPLFGRVEPGWSAAGGIGLYLDHPMFDTRHGGGLDEQLEVAVVVEQLDQGFDDVPGSVQTSAAAVGADPILDDQGDPFEEDGDSPERLWYLIDDGSWNPGPPVRYILRAGTILGQTLEPNSPAPQFPFAIAFIEPAIEDALLKPGTMAKIEVRTIAGVERSDWSAPLWVHFLPDMAGTVVEAGMPVSLLTITWAGDKLVVAANEAAGDMGEACMRRWLALSQDRPPGDTPKGPYLVSRVLGVIVRTIYDAAGRPRPRVAGISSGTRNGDRLHFEIPEGISPSHLRILEVQRVSGADIAGAWIAPPDASAGWFGNPAPRHLGDGGPHGSMDIGERVVGFGPLLALARGAP